MARPGTRVTGADLIQRVWPVRNAQTRAHKESAVSILITGVLGDHFVIFLSYILFEIFE